MDTFQPDFLPARREGNKRDNAYYSQGFLLALHRSVWCYDKGISLGRQNTPLKTFDISPVEQDEKDQNWRQITATSGMIKLKLRNHSFTGDGWSFGAGSLSLLVRHSSQGGEIDLLKMYSRYIGWNEAERRFRRIWSSLREKNHFKQSGLLTSIEPNDLHTFLHLVSLVQDHYSDLRISIDPSHNNTPKDIEKILSRLQGKMNFIDTLPQNIPEIMERFNDAANKEPIQVAAGQLQSLDPDSQYIVGLSYALQLLFATAGSSLINIQSEIADIKQKCASLIEKLNNDINQARGVRESLGI